MQSHLHSRFSAETAAATWFQKMSHDEQAAYLKKHPASHFTQHAGDMVQTARSMIKLHDYKAADHRADWSGKDGAASKGAEKLHAGASTEWKGVRDAFKSGDHVAGHAALKRAVSSSIEAKKASKDLSSAHRRANPRDAGGFFIPQETRDRLEERGPAKILKTGDMYWPSKK